MQICKFGPAMGNHCKLWTLAILFLSRFILSVYMLYVSILAELVILRSNVQQFVMTRGEYLNGVNTFSSPFYFLGREKIKKLTLNKLYLMKFILEDNEGKHTIKFENWQLKPNNVVWFKNCISRDLGKLL